MLISRYFLVITKYIHSLLIQYKLSLFSIILFFSTLSMRLQNKERDTKLLTIQPANWKIFINICIFPKVYRIKIWSSSFNEQVLNQRQKYVEYFITSSWTDLEETVCWNWNTYIHVNCQHVSWNFLIYKCGLGHLFRYSGIENSSNIRNRVGNVIDN